LWGAKRQMVAQMRSHGLLRGISNASYDTGSSICPSPNCDKSGGRTDGIVPMLGSWSGHGCLQVVNTVLLRLPFLIQVGLLSGARYSGKPKIYCSELLTDNYRHYQNLRPHASSNSGRSPHQKPTLSASPLASSSANDGGSAVSPNFFLGARSPAIFRTGLLPRRKRRAERQSDILRLGPCASVSWQPSVVGRPASGGELQNVVVECRSRSASRVHINDAREGNYGSTERYEIFKPLVATTDELTANGRRV